MGLPTSKTDRNGNTTTNTYNAYGSILTSSTTGGGENTDYDAAEDIINIKKPCLFIFFKY